MGTPEELTARASEDSPAVGTEGRRRKDAPLRATGPGGGGGREGVKGCELRGGGGEGVKGCEVQGGGGAAGCGGGGGRRLRAAGAMGQGGGMRPRKQKEDRVEAPSCTPAMQAGCGGAQPSACLSSSTITKGGQDYGTMARITVPLTV